nr:MAG TPA: hypothetical protein [Bacteriophage sp.]
MTIGLDSYASVPEHAPIFLNGIGRMRGREL